MSNTNNKKETEALLLRKKLFEIEDSVNEIRTLNNLFIPFANENCPEGLIIAGLISRQVDEIIDTILCE